MTLKRLAVVLTALFALTSLAQDVPQSLAPLTVPKIMRDPAWMGHSPDNLWWSLDSSCLYFDWNPENAPSDSLYVVSAQGGTPKMVGRDERLALSPRWGLVWNRDRSQVLFSRDGDLFLHTVRSGQTRRLTQTEANESNPLFSGDERSVLFRLEDNLFRLSLTGGELVQLTHFVRQGRRERGDKKNAQEQYLADEAIALSAVLQSEKAKREAREAVRETDQPQASHEEALGKRRIQALAPSPDGRFVAFTLVTPAEGNRNTQVPEYVTESGFVEEQNAYPYVGATQGSYELGVWDLQRDTVYYADAQTLSGITDPPDYLKEAAQSDSTVLKDFKRDVWYGSPLWSDDGATCVLSIQSQDNKDRWITRLAPESAALETLDRQRDEAWIGGPGAGGWRGSLGFLPDNRRIWFQSEATGYSHLYTLDIPTGQKTALTSGSYEVYSPQLSKSGKSFYFTANIVHPGVRHFYRLPVTGGEPVQLTSLHGGHQVALSPDEKTLAYRYSTANTPWELYLQPNRPGARPKQITHSTTAEFESYAWRVPEFVTFTARDGQAVHARLYRPTTPAPSKPGVIFVHGAGYLQNAHQWWSDYFHEYFFHNLLADQGYTVLDIDYRGSAGYGRDWRTAIYRHMGGLDLTDQVDGAHYLAQSCGVNPDRIGLYGGSYGGFITLMALFTEPETFAAGAALRSVTDWAHYHHGYTSPILNTPVADSTAYRRSSPIYFAEGLQGALLMCHGMVDTNVHFQDIVRLSQRLIELGKTNWELAVYPVENHGFEQPSSWTDEYRRIFKLFETHLK